VSVRERGVEHGAAARRRELGEPLQIQQRQVLCVQRSTKQINTAEHLTTAHINLSMD
jgi:hypothetical protein